MSDPDRLRSTGHVVPDKDLIRKHLRDRAWFNTELKEKAAERWLDKELGKLQAGAKPRAVDKALAGKVVEVSTLKAIANALGVPYSTLVSKEKQNLSNERSFSILESEGDLIKITLNIQMTLELPRGASPPAEVTAFMEYLQSRVPDQTIPPVVLSVGKTSAIIGIANTPANAAALSFEAIDDPDPQPPDNTSPYPEIPDYVLWLYQDRHIKIEVEGVPTTIELLNGEEHHVFGVSDDIISGYEMARKSRRGKRPPPWGIMKPRQYLNFRIRNIQNYDFEQAINSMDWDDIRSGKSFEVDTGNLIELYNFTYNQIREFSHAFRRQSFFTCSVSRDSRCFGHWNIIASTSIFCVN